MATRANISAYGYHDPVGQTVTTGLGDTLNVSAGQCVVGALVWMTTDASPAIGDSLGTIPTFGTKRKHPTRPIWVQPFWFLNHPGGSGLTVGADFGEGVTPDYKCICVAVYNVAESAAFVSEEWGYSTASPTATTGSMAATGSGLIFVGGSGWSTINWSAGSGYTLVRAISNEYGFADRLITDAGSYTASMSDSGNEDIVIAALLIQDVAGPSFNIAPVASFYRRMLNN